MKEKIKGNEDIKTRNKARFFDKRNIKKYLSDILSFLDREFNGKGNYNALKHYELSEYLIGDSTCINIDTMVKLLKEQRELNENSEKKNELPQKSYYFGKDNIIKLEEYKKLYSRYNEIMSDDTISDRKKIIELETLDRLIVSVSGLRGGFGSEGLKGERKIFFSDDTIRDNIFYQLNGMSGFKGELRMYEGIIDNQKKYIIARKDELSDYDSEIGSENIEKDKHGISNSTRIKYLDIIFGNEEISDGTFLYERDKGDKDGKNNGYTKFLKLSLSKEYSNYIGKNDKETLKLMNKYLRSIENFWIKNHIELGPGDAGKIFELYKGVEKDILHGSVYRPIDVSGVGLDIVAKNIANKEKELNIKFENVDGSHTDFNKASIYKETQNQMYYFLGGSIGNFDYDNMVELLSKLKSNEELKTTPTLVTYFLAPDKKLKDYEQKKTELLLAYGNKEAADSILSGFESLGIDRNSLEYIVEYDEDSLPLPMIKMGAIIKEDIKVEINGKMRKKNKGEKIRAIKSQRFTKEQFEELVLKTGHTIRHTEVSGGVALSMIEYIKPKKKLKDTVKDIVKKYNKAPTRVVVGTLVLAMASSSAYRENSIKGHKKGIRSEQLSKIEIRKDDEVTMERQEVESTEKKRIIIENKLKNIKSILKSMYVGELDDDEYNEIYNKFEETVYSEKNLYVYMNNDDGKKYNLIADLKYVTYIIDNNNDFSNIEKYSHLLKYENEMISALEKGEDYIKIDDANFQGFFTTDGKFLEKKVDIRNYFLQKYNDPILNIVGYFKGIFYPENQNNDRIENYDINKIYDIKDANKNLKLLLKDIILKGIYKQKGMNGNDMFDCISSFTKKYNLEKINQYTKYEKYRDIFEYTDSLFKPTQTDDDVFKKRYELKFIGNYYYMGVQSMCDIYVGKYNGKKVLFASIHDNMAITYYSLFLGEQIANDYIHMNNKIINYIEK